MLIKNLKRISVIISPLTTSIYVVGYYKISIAVPTRVVASAATGIATSGPYNCDPQTEDTITLLVDWQSIKSKNHKGTAVYTASWTAPLKSGVHSAQHWYYMAEKVPRSLKKNNIFTTILTPAVYFDFRAISTWTKPIVGTTSLSMTAVRLGSIHFSVYKFPAHYY